MNRAALMTAVQDYAARNDLTPSLLNSFLALAEQRIYVGGVESEPLRHYKMQKAAQLSLAVDARSGSFDSLSLMSGASGGVIPSDFLDVIRCTYDNGGRQIEIEYRSPARMAMDELSSDTGAVFGIRGDSFVFSPAPVGPVNLIYYARPPTPVADADENWIMSSAPGVYLFSMLLEVATYLRDEAMVGEYSSRYVGACGALQGSGQRTQWGGMSQLRITTGR